MSDTQPAAPRFSFYSDVCKLVSIGCAAFDLFLVYLIVCDLLAGALISFSIAAGVLIVMLRITDGAMQRGWPHLAPTTPAADKT